MRHAMGLISGFLLAALPAQAQDVQWDLVDAGVLNHSSHGNGIEMRIQPNPVPEGLFGAENLDGILRALCNHYAPYVIPLVQQQKDIKDPDFVAVRIVTGAAVGRFVLQVFEVSDGKCGSEL